MKSVRFLIATILLTALFLTSNSAFAAGDCIVSNEYGDNSEHSLIYEYINLMGGKCTDDVVIIDGDKTINVTSGMYLSGNKRIVGEVDGSGYPLATIIADGISATALFELAKDKSGSEPTLENLIIEAPGKIAIRFADNSNGHYIKNVYVRNSDTGVLVLGDENIIEESEISENAEGLKVTGSLADHNLITKTNFINNGDTGIELVSGGNDSIQEATNLKAVYKVNSKYLLLGKVESTIQDGEFFTASIDKEEGNNYEFKINSTDITTINGQKLITKIINKNTSLHVALTVMDADDNTSEFAHFGPNANKITGDPENCMDEDWFLEAYIENPNNPWDVDTDGDGLSNGEEDKDKDCEIDPTESDPEDPTDPGDPVICPEGDIDGDEICDPVDNCVNVHNPQQLDLDGDGIGDMCESFYGDQCSDYWDYVNHPDTTPENGQEGMSIFLECCDVHPDEQACLDLGCAIKAFFAWIFDNDTDGDGVSNDEDNCPEIPNGMCKGDENQLDFDNDGVGNVCDNCPAVYNPLQDDMDSNGAGDACQDDPDVDNDGIYNDADNCPSVSNANQDDMDKDGIGDACDFDLDGDGTDNVADNCPDIMNVKQSDIDGDGLGDACDPVDNAILVSDLDGDGVLNVDDNCILVDNADQTDSDNNGIGDACDAQNSSILNDLDGDGVTNHDDNCPAIDNVGQEDSDADGIGDACEGYVDNGDIDGDGIANWDDNCIFTVNPDQHDSDGDGKGDACESMTDGDEDIDGDTIINNIDNCPFLFNPVQADSDNDNIGDVCDLDMINLDENGDLDEDGILNGADNCPAIDNPSQTDSDSNGIGDACQLTLDPDNDFDGDGTINSEDNCPVNANADQLDTDDDGIGDVCDPYNNILGSGNEIPLEQQYEVTGGRRFNGEGCSLIPGTSGTASMINWILLAMTAIFIGIRRPFGK